MDLLGQSALFLALASLALGLSTLADNIKNKLFISYSILTTTISLWALSFFLNKLLHEPFFNHLHLMFHVLIIPSALAFMQVLVKRFTFLGKKLFWISQIISISLWLILFFRLETIPYIHKIIAFSPCLIALQIFDLIWQRMFSKKNIHSLDQTMTNPRRGYLYKGAMITLCIATMEHIPFLGKTIPAIGNFSLAGYLYFLSQAIRKQRLLNVSALFSRTLVLFLLAALLTAAYTLLVIWTKDSLSLFIVNSFAASFLLLTLLEPLRNIVTYLSKQFLTQKYLKLQSVLTEEQKKLTGVVDLSGLFGSLMTFLNQTLKPEWGAIYILKADGTKFKRLREVGKMLHPLPKELLVTNPLLEYCYQLHKKSLTPIVLEQLLENEIERSASQTQRNFFEQLLQSLESFGCNLLIPFIGSSSVLGFLVLRVETPADPWQGNWGVLSIIYPYFESVANTLQNMDIYVRQREKERLAALGEMSAGLAHEIRNPLGAIKGAAQFLDPSKDQPESKFLQVIIDEVDRLNRVVTQFLDYSKPSLEEKERIHLGQLIKKTLEFIQPNIPPQIQLEFFSSKLAATVIGNPEQLRQVFINLIQNSQKALQSKPSGIIRISVGVEFDATLAEVILSIEDTGIGIQKEHLDKLFIPFFTTFPSGTGLGLSICHKIIEAHKGRIEVYSEPERWTKFIVILPYVKEAPLYAK